MLSNENKKTNVPDKIIATIPDCPHRHVQTMTVHILRGASGSVSVRYNILTIMKIRQKGARVKVVAEAISFIQFK